MTVRPPVVFNQCVRSTERNTSAGVGPGVLSRALAVLDAFDARAPVLGVSEIARRCGLPKSTVHRQLTELSRARLVAKVRDPETGATAYQLGLRLFELGERVPVRRSLADLAAPIMEDLREVTRHRIHLAVLEGVDVVYVAILGSGAVEVGSRVGGRLPAHATGVGKVMLAYAAPSVVAARIAAGLPQLTARTISTPQALEAELAKIRTHGFALDIEESTVGVLCVAAPVFGPGRRIVASLSATGITRSVDPGTIGPAVRTAAFTLTRALRDSTG